MKNLSRIILIALPLFFMAGCDEGFEEANTSPTFIPKISDPGLLLTNILRNTSAGGGWQGESTIVQHFVLPYNLGTTAGYQFNENVDGTNSGPFGLYTGTIRTSQALMDMTKDDPARTNLYNMAKIWRAYHFMYLVDHYGDVPYSEAQKAQTEGLFYPKYDKGADIYDDLYKQIKEATAALDPAKDNNSRFDIFMSATGTTATEITFWKRLGNSLLLRLGMRYTKADLNKAKTIVQEAYNGGVMQSNADNVVIVNSTGAGNATAITGYNNGRNGVFGTNVFNYYLAKPLIDFLKSTNDPRTKYISAKYNNPGSALTITNPDTTVAAQFGFPIGYSDATITPSVPGYRDRNAAPAITSAASGLNYSQVNMRVTGSTLAPVFVITNAQTKLLLAEAAFRGFLPAGAKTAKEYYDEGIIASMDSYSLFPNTLTPAVSTASKNGYLNRVAYNPATALQQINTQYWVECFTNGDEAWNNFRRSGFPVLARNTFNDNLLVGGGDGFIRRFSYPLAEQSNNTASYQAAVSALGGPDYLTTRVFWDK